jgi:hypothetical protein
VPLFVCGRQEVTCQIYRHLGLDRVEDLRGMLKLIDEHWFRARDEKARVCDWLTGGRGQAAARRQAVTRRV